MTSRTLTFPFTLYIGPGYSRQESDVACWMGGSLWTSPDQLVLRTYTPKVNVSDGQATLEGMPIVTAAPARSNFINIWSKDRALANGNPDQYVRWDMVTSDDELDLLVSMEGSDEQSIQSLRDLPSRRVGLFVGGRVEIISTQMVNAPNSDSHWHGTDPMRRTSYWIRGARPMYECGRCVERTVAYSNTAHYVRTNMNPGWEHQLMGAANDYESTVERCLWCRRR